MIEQSTIYNFLVVYDNVSALNSALRAKYEWR